MQLDNTAEYYLKNPGILTHQDLLEEYGVAGEVATNMLEDKGKIFQRYSLHCWLLLRSHMNPFIVHKKTSTWVLSTLYNCWKDPPYPPPQHLCERTQLFFKTFDGRCPVTGTYKHSDELSGTVKFGGGFLH